MTPLVRRAAGLAGAAGLIGGQLIWPTATLAATDPVIRNDRYEMWEDEKLHVAAPGVLGNDTPGRAGLLSNLLCVVHWDDYEAVAVPFWPPPTVHAFVSPWGQDGSFSIDASPNAYGETQVWYWAVEYGLRSDCPRLGEAITWTGIVDVTIRPVNDRPELGPGSAGLTVHVAEDSGPVTVFDVARVTSFGPFETDFVEAWEVATKGWELFASGPSVDFDGDSSTQGALHFTPAPNANGSTTVLIKVRDTGGSQHGGIDLSNAVAFGVHIEPVPDAPTAAGDSYSVTAGNTLRVGAPGILANDADVDGDTLTATLGSFPLHGDVSMTADGSFTYRPDAGFVGRDSFAYRASDGTFTTGPTTVAITVREASAPSPSTRPSTRPTATLPRTSPPPPLTETPPQGTMAPGFTDGSPGSGSLGSTLEETTGAASLTTVEPSPGASVVAAAGLGTEPVAPHARAPWALAIGIVLLLVGVLALGARLRSARIR